MFLFMAFGAAHIANLPDALSKTSTGEPFISTASLMFIATSFGLSLLVNVWVFFRVSGALFNPAISLALALTGVIGPLRAALLTLVQIVAGITAAALIKGLMPEPLNVNTRLSSNISIAQGQTYNCSLMDRSLHRSVFDRPIGSVRVHASRRETQSYIPRPRWHRINIIR